MEFLKGKLGVCLIAVLSASIILSLLFSAGFLNKQSIRVSDLFYSENKAFSDITLIVIDDKSIQDIGRWPWSRAVFANAIEKLNEAKIIGIDVSFSESGEGDSSFKDAINNKIILVSECKLFKGKECAEWLFPVFNATTAAANIYAEDEIARSVPYQIDGMKSLSALVSEKYLGKESRLSDKILINYAKPGSFETISFSDLINNKNISVKEKIALIGATAKDLHDEKLTPLSSKPLPGVEIHANAVQTIITGKFLHYQENLSVILSIFIISAIIALTLYFFRLTYGIISLIVIPAAYIMAGTIAFDSGIILNLLYPLISLILTFAIIIILYYLMEAKEKKWVSHLFGKYVSPNVADELIRQGKSAVNLKGTRKTVTMLFADVRGFTSFSEKTSPERVVSLLNKYHGKMTDIIFKYKGTLDKYVGDEIMATYNVPLDLENHALAAVQTAIEMQKAAIKMGKTFKYGIGINTGSVIVGNIGSEKRLDYTVIGDSVNLAARLCSKAEGSHILISDSTYDLVKNKIKTRSIGEISVKGKTKPVRVHEVIY